MAKPAVNNYKALKYCFSHRRTEVYKQEHCMTTKQVSLNRELKKPWWWRRGQHWLKNEFIFYLQISRHPKVSYFVYHCQSYRKTESRTHWYIHRGSWSPNNAEFDHFMLLICRGRQRNVPRIMTHVHSHCSPHLTFCLAPLPLPLLSWLS